ncbi:hypothetical protein H0H92_015643, partial [Tricholoma furcatifolium]
MEEGSEDENFDSETDQEVYEKPSDLVDVDELTKKGGKDVGGRPRNNVLNRLVVR